MLVLVCYDVDTRDTEGQRRLRRIADTCKDYGVRVQYSVFECRIAQRDWVTLRDRLLREYDAARDSLRIYFLDDGDASRTEHHGIRRPTDVRGPLII